MATQHRPYVPTQGTGNRSTPSPRWIRRLSGIVPMGRWETSIGPRRTRTRSARESHPDRSAERAQRDTKEAGARLFGRGGRSAAGYQTANRCATYAGRARGTQPRDATRRPVRCRAPEDARPRRAREQPSPHDAADTHHGFRPMPSSRWTSIHADPLPATVKE